MRPADFTGGRNQALPFILFQIKSSPFGSINSRAYFDPQSVCDGEKSIVKGPMMAFAEAQTVPRIIRSLIFN